MIIIRGKEVRFEAKQINGVYGLDNVDIRDYEAKDCAIETGWLSIYAREGRSHSPPLRVGY